MKRYTTYKDSGVQWLGEIPSHWEVKRLASYFTERREKVSDRDYSALSVTKKGIFPQLENVAKTQDGDNRKLVKAGDFVINSRSDRKGSSGVSPLDGSVSLINIVLQPRKKVFPSYCNYLLKSYAFIEEYYRNGRGIVADLWTTRYDEMRSIKLPMPPLSEQHAIAAYLDTQTANLDTAISQQQQMIDLLNERKQIVINKAVTRGLDDNVALKDSGVDWIGDVPEHWEVKKLKNIATRLRKGNGITKEDIVENGNIPCVRYGEIYTKYKHSFSQCVTRTNIEKIKPARYFSNGDLLFAGTGELVAEIGKCIVYVGQEKCLAGGDIIVAEHEQDPKFMGYALDCDYTQHQKSYDKLKLKVVHISATDIGNILVALPPLSEQTAIAAYLDKQCSQIDTAISQAQQQIALLQERKQIIINDVVTGKVKIM